MKRLTALVLIVCLTGCASTSYQEYALAMTRIAEAQAQIAREQSLAMIALARDPNAGETTRTVAVLMLALGVQNSKSNSPSLQPPQNEALQWATVILPTAATLGLGYWGYKLGVAQSNNSAATTQASYTAFTKFATPIDFTKIPPQTINTTTTNTTINTRTDTDITNRDGVVAVGADPTASQDNRVTNPTPVVVVPPVVPIVPVVTGP